MHPTARQPTATGAEVGHCGPFPECRCTARAADGAEKVRLARRHCVIMAGMTAAQSDTPTAVQVSDGISVKVRITDGNWYQAGAGRVWADVHAKAAGNVMLEAGTRAGRYYAAAFYFLSTPLLDKSRLEPP